MVVEDIARDALCAVVFVVEAVVDDDGDDYDVDPDREESFSHLRDDLLCLGVVVLVLQQLLQGLPDNSVEKQQKNRSQKTEQSKHCVG